MTLIDTLKSLETPLMADGKIDLGETSILLRAVRPFAAKGDNDAIGLENLLRRVRSDGVITPVEAEEIRARLSRVVYGEDDVSQFIREVPDFPRKGMRYLDITGLFGTPGALDMALNAVGKALEGVEFDLVVSPESLGGIFGAAIAARFGKAFAPVCRPGILPCETAGEEYDHEFGVAELCMHADAIIPGERVLIVDDTLFTGRTVAAAARLVERLGGKAVALVFVAEFEGFGARSGVLADRNVISLARYRG